MFICGDLSKLSQQQCVLVLSKPYWRMRQFASLLGWRGLVLSWTRITDEEAKCSPTPPKTRLFVYYVTTDERFRIQINELPAGQSRYYQAAIAPFHYRISQTEWHPFELFDNDAALIGEAERLRGFLHRQRFRDPVQRAAFKKAHPNLFLSAQSALLMLR